MVHEKLMLALLCPRPGPALVGREAAWSINIQPSGTTPFPGRIFGPILRPNARRWSQGLGEIGRRHAQRR